MKWNVLFGSLVLTMGLCTQGFSAGLLDRMLGVSGCCGSSCCEASCGAAAACCDNACVDTCCEAPVDTCCNARPSCGCGLNLGGCRGGGLFSSLFRSHGCGCNSCCDAEPTCGVAATACPSSCCETSTCCEPTCGAASSCCGRRNLWSGGLFSGLFRQRGCCGCAEPSCGVAITSSCCEPTCGCASGCDSGASRAEADPSMPPAPVVDPSAYKAPSKLQVIKASHTASFGRWSKR